MTLEKQSLKEFIIKHKDLLKKDLEELGLTLKDLEGELQVH